MTPEQTNITIAELRGKTPWLHCVHHGRVSRDKVVINDYGMRVCYKCGYVMSLMDCPDYAHNLNACAAFEKTLVNESWWKYVEHLTDICGGGIALCISATAIERCEAFIRTVAPDKWKEDAV